MCVIQGPFHVFREVLPGIERLSGKGSAWSALGKLAATWPPTFPPKTLYAIRFYGAKLELAATRHTRSDSGSQFGCRRPHIGCNIRFANILWSLSCRPAKTGGPVGPSLSGQPLSGAPWIRSLYHHEKQLDKVVRLHNSRGRNAMRRLKFDFIKISCVTYKGHSTLSLRETLLVAQVSSSVTRN